MNKDIVRSRWTQIQRFTRHNTLKLMILALHKQKQMQGRKRESMTIIIYNQAYNQPTIVNYKKIYTSKQNIVYSSKKRIQGKGLCKAKRKRQGRTKAKKQRRKGQILATLKAHQLVHNGPVAGRKAGP